MGLQKTEHNQSNTQTLLTLEVITNKVNSFTFSFTNFVNNNFIVKLLLEKNNKISDAIKLIPVMSKYSPEIIFILSQDKRGLEILKETGLYDYLTTE